MSLVAPHHFPPQKRSGYKKKKAKRKHTSKRNGTQRPSVEGSAVYGTARHAQHESASELTTQLRGLPGFRHQADRRRTTLETAASIQTPGGVA